MFGDLKSEAPLGLPRGEVKQEVIHLLLIYPSFSLKKSADI